ncbi:MAG: peroxidase family protein, partial [Planctomycetota bacterium]
MNRTAPLLTGLAALGVAACATSNQSSTIKNTGTPTGDALVVTPAAAPVSAHTAHAGGGIEACPVMGHGAPAAALAANAAEPTDDLKVADWWPNRLDLSILRMNSEKSDPMGDGFDYRAEFEKVDLAALKADIAATMTDSQEWWPADWGTYAGLFIRMAWHSAGTYRNTDGRGGSADGALRFAPLNSWPDNANLDKSRRLLWPVKKKYGRAVSWADLMVLAGNVALERSGFETLGFAGGREDVWEPQEDVFWGPEGEWLADERYEGDRELQGELAAVQMGLIYVNPEGPNGNPDPIAAARDIRETFGRMAMNDEETAALIAGGHTLGKAHGAGAASNVGPEPEGASITEQGFGWTSSYGTGAGKDAITSGLEGAWTSTPTEWSSEYLENLWGYEWEMTKSPAGATQWTPKGGPSSVPDAHVDGKRNKVVMFTTDLALREDPAYAAITQRWLEDPELFDAAFASAWYKLTHRDMGPVARLLGDEVAPAQLWQDPVPAVDHALVGNAEVADLKKSILATGLSPQQLVSVAWASASTYRGSDMRGGANGARIALAPQTGWAANDPNNLEKVLGVYGLVQSNFNEAREDGM